MKLSDLSDKVTVADAYLAMFRMLSDRYDMTKSDDIGNLLGDLSLMGDGGSADPAAIGDWKKYVDLATSGKVDASMRLIQDEKPQNSTPQSSACQASDLVG
jgi:hypothetical protein